MWSCPLDALRTGCAPSSTGISAARPGSKHACSPPRTSRRPPRTPERPPRNAAPAVQRVPTVPERVSRGHRSAAYLRAGLAPIHREALPMKVVLFCGGLGMRLRDYSEHIPKPMINIGYRPILWHVMRYYAYYGYHDFILCLGYGADVVKNYFLNYSECVSNDFVLSQGGKSLQLLNSDIHDWKITFADTGLTSNIGQRLKAAEKYLAGEDVFLANYSDGLTDAPLATQMEQFRRSGKVASFLCVRQNLSYSFVST